MSDSKLIEGPTENQCSAGDCKQRARTSARGRSSVATWTASQPEPPPDVSGLGFSQHHVSVQLHSHDVGVRHLEHGLQEKLFLFGKEKEDRFLKVVVLPAHWGQTLQRLHTDTHHDGPQAASSSLPLQSHPGYGPQGIFIHIKVTLKPTRTGIIAKFKHPPVKQHHSKRLKWRQNNLGFY